MTHHTVSIALVVGMLSAALARDDEPQKRFRRLPPVTAEPSVVELSRPSARPSAESTDEPMDLVLFAAGAVQLRPPRGWWVRELPHGREVLLVVSPSESGSQKSPPVDGVWISYHAKPKSQQSAESELLSMINPRVRLAVGNAAVLKQPVRRQLANWPSVEIEFDRSDPARLDKASPARGSHILVLTDWGVVELHVSAPPDVYDARSGEFERLLSDLSLVEPQAESSEVSAEVADARDVVGAWKAYRSRLRLSADGTIEIEGDRTRVIPPSGTQRRYEYAKMSLAGRFRAEDDLLYVVWNDGSKLNFRWKLSGSDLLLTDHEGQISQLRRLYE